MVNKPTPGARFGGQRGGGGGGGGGLWGIILNGALQINDQICREKSPTIWE